MSTEKGSDEKTVPAVGGSSYNCFPISTQIWMTDNWQCPYFLGTHAANPSVMFDSENVPGCPYLDHFPPIQINVKTENA